MQKVIQRSHHPLPQQIEILLQKFHQPVSPIQKIALPTMEGLQMIAGRFHYQLCVREQLLYSSS